MNLAAGTRLGPYEVIGTLGAGGMGEVYRARDTRLAREVALKVLPASYSSDPDRLRRFEQEARAASALNHPNIVTIYDVGKADASAYIAMERVEGKTLRELMEGERLSLRRALDVATQIADGLAKAHAAGIVHRDLKPENVMISKDGFVKILDFGLAKLVAPSPETPVSSLPTAAEAATGTGWIVGTTAYMSPEQASGKPIDFRSDQFALGSILYEMLAGRRAFGGETAVETLAAIVRQDPRPIRDEGPDVPQPLEWALGRCLAKDPEDRYASTRDLARDLRTIREHLSVAGSAPALSPSPPRGRSLRRFVLLVAVAVAAALAFLAGRAVKSRSAPVSFERLTFRRGMIWSGRFAPDRQTIVYSAAWDGGPVRLFSKRRGGTESRALELLTGKILSISSKGEIAFLSNPRFVFFYLQPGTLARSDLEGAASRELLEDVLAADWSPDGNDLAVVRTVNGKSRLEYPLGTPIFESDAPLSSVRVSSDGQWVAFFEHKSLNTSVIAVRRSREKRTLSQGWWLASDGLAWSPDGSEVWYTAQPGLRPRSGGVMALYATSLSGVTRPVTQLPGEVKLLDIDRDGRVLLASWNFRAALVYFSAAGSSERDLSWLDHSFLGSLSADGKTIVFDDTALFVRAADGSPAVRLAQGYTFGLADLSPDKRWVLTSPEDRPGRLVLVPTGAGEVNKLERLPLCAEASWFPDSRRILCATTDERERRLLVHDVVSGATRGLTLPGSSRRSRWTVPKVSPDGNRVAWVDSEDRAWIVPVDGGVARAIPTKIPEQNVIGWTEDGRALYLYRIGDVPGKVQTLEIATGRLTLWRQMMPVDAAGVVRIHPVRVTPDGNAYAYSYTRVLSDLYLVNGLK